MSNIIDFIIKKCGIFITGIIYTGKPIYNTSSYGIQNILIDNTGVHEDSKYNVLVVTTNTAQLNTQTIDCIIIPNNINVDGYSTVALVDNFYLIIKNTIIRNNLNIMCLLKKLQCVSINMKSNISRRMRVRELIETTKIDIRIDNAVDGKRLKFEETDIPHLYSFEYNTVPYYTDTNYKKLSRGEIGCFLSHILVYEKFLLQDVNEYLFVFEDDAKINDTVHLFDTLDKLPPSNSFDYCTVASNIRFYPPQLRSKINDVFYTFAKNNFNITSGYIITKAGCSKILDSLKFKNSYKISVPIDNSISDLFLNNKLTCITVKDRYVDVCEPSVIWDTDNYLNVSWGDEYIKKHISIGFSGRLGNQMFQYAFIKIMDIIYGYTIVFNRDNINSELLKTFDIDGWIENKNLKYESYVEPNFHYDDIKNITLTNNIDVSGYFQSLKYFEQIGDMIKDIYKPSYSDLNLYKNIILNWRESGEYLVSIHIRLGDIVPIEYYEPPVYGIVTQKYITASVNRMIKKFGKCKFLVFSDSLDIAKQYNIPGAVYVDIDTSPKIGLNLMMMCDHNIISSSTYSWWSAWLNNNKNKCVICPTPWFNIKCKRVADNDTSTLLPDNWEYYDTINDCFKNI